MIFRRTICRQLLCILAACTVTTVCCHPGVSATRMVTIEDPAIPLADSGVLTPSSPGTISWSSGGAMLDASNASEGYVSVRYNGSTRAKVQITCAGKNTYTYNLRSDGVYEVFPLSCGDGTYQILVFYNISGSQYAQALSKNIEVRLSNPLGPFLYPNQYVSFTAASQAVAKSKELAGNAGDSLEIVSSVYNYVTGNISYDSEKAQLVSSGQLSGYIPNVDSVLAAKKGICFDYAALMTAMLRAQKIPTRMELGYVSGGLYHAWISVYINDIGWINGMIQFDGKTWKLMDPTFAAGSGSSGEVMQYIGDSNNYQTMYLY